MQILSTYGRGPYTLAIKKAENDLREIQKRVNEKMGVKESDTGLAPPNLWDVPADKQRLQEEGPCVTAQHAWSKRDASVLTPVSLQ